MAAKIGPMQYAIASRYPRGLLRLRGNVTSQAYGPNIPNSSDSNAGICTGARGQPFSQPQG